MDKSLFDLTCKYSSLSIIGMCKNAGKTTALNSLVNSVPDSEVLALTSIGRDGERVDTVTGTKKPGIYIKEGSLFATAEKLLRSCDVTREILEATDISTPLGDVVLARALSDGNVEIAGPSIIAQLTEISGLFRAHGADRIFIDGAAGRKTLCTGKLADATILCAGASFSPNMEETIAETAHICSLLMTKELPEIKKQIETIKLSGKYIIFAEEITAWQDGIDIAEALKKTKAPHSLYICGAITDNLLDCLIRAGCLGALTLIADDASKLLLSSGFKQKLTALSCRLGVLEEINLAAITTNPFSAYGSHYESDTFIQKMQSAVPVPVINVKGTIKC